MDFAFVSFVDLFYFLYNYLPSPPYKFLFSVFDAANSRRIKISPMVEIVSAMAEANVAMPPSEAQDVSRSLKQLVGGMGYLCYSTILLSAISYSISCTIL